MGREWSEDSLCWTNPGPPRGPPDHSRPTEGASGPLSAQREGRSTNPGSLGGPPNHSLPFGRAPDHRTTFGLSGAPLNYS